MNSEDKNTVLLREECEEILFSFGQNAKLINYKISKFSDAVVGFSAEHYLLILTFSNKGDRTYSQQTFFLKSLPTSNESRNAYVKEMGVFKKEILVYKNLLSEFLKLSNKNFAPKHYFSSERCIVFEDLSSKNYKLYDSEYLNFEKCKTALECVAGLHASSIIFEELRSTKEKAYRINDHFKNEVKETTFSFVEGHVRNVWSKTSTKCLVNLRKYFTDNVEVDEKIEYYIFSDSGLRQKLQPSASHRNVLCHDDLWRNNMMFNEQNQCVLVDFQLVRYTPPIFDVLLLLNINLERNFLKINLHAFLAMYYDFLKNELSANEIYIGNIIPENDFFDSVEEYTLPALIECCIYGTFTYLPEELASKVLSSLETFEEFTFKNRSQFIVKEFENNKQFRKRFENVLRSMYEIFEKM